jgi:hypothetical protein
VAESSPRIYYTTRLASPEGELNALANAYRLTLDKRGLDNAGRRSSDGATGKSLRG